MAKQKVAFITGITGQDGSYLAELLLKKGYVVFGLLRRSSTFNRANIEHIFDTQEKRRKYLLYGDMTDGSSLISILNKIKPDEIYNLAAQTHVRISYDIPYYTAEANSLGTLSLLEALRTLNIKSKVYQGSTSELYSGDPKETPQNEKTPFRPMSPYGVSKLFGFEIGRVYRESYGMFISNGILFNHESPRRGINFVTRKISRGVAEIKTGLRDKIYLGNLDAKRDWGYAPEYMEAAWKILQQKQPDDYVIATGETHSVREFVEHAFGAIGVEIIWKIGGLKEKGIDKKTKKVLVEIDPDYFRPNEVRYLCGDPSKARKEFNWKPKTKFNELIKIMVKADLENIKND